LLNYTVFEMDSAYNNWCFRNFCCIWFFR